MTGTNPFVDGTSLKTGCGFRCIHLRCTTKCKRARSLCGLHPNLIKKTRSKALSVIKEGNNLEAHTLILNAKNAGLISVGSFDKFETDHF